MLKRVIGHEKRPTDSGAARARAYNCKTKQLQRKNPAIKGALSREEQDAARAFWSRFGVSIDPEWHGIYSATSGRSDARFVPEDIYYALLEPALNVLEQAPAYSDKNVYERLFPDVCVPTALLRRMGELYYTGSGEWLSEHDAVRCLEKAAPDDFVAKLSVRSGGDSMSPFSAAKLRRPRTPVPGTWSHAC